MVFLLKWAVVRDFILRFRRYRKRHVAVHHDSNYRNEKQEVKDFLLHCTKKSASEYSYVKTVGCVYGSVAVQASAIALRNVRGIAACRAAHWPEGLPDSFCLG
jgi:hypothetical protein